jgi:hypothetical protein
LFNKNILFFWLAENYLYIRIEFNAKRTIKCQITVFILATLIISSLGSKDCAMVI